jgi:glycogen debranching enzyme
VKAVASTDSPFVTTAEPTTLGDPSSLVMLVEGQTFCVSERTGDIVAGSAHGLFHADIRLLSLARLTFDDNPIEPLAVALDGSFGATMVGRVSLPTDGGAVQLLVIRRRTLGAVCDETLDVRYNGGHEPMSCTIELEVDADFADVFSVKEHRVVPRGDRSTDVRRDQLIFMWRDGPVQRQVRIRGTGPGVKAHPGGVRWNVDLPAHSSTTFSWSVDVDTESQRFGGRSHPSFAGDLSRSGQRYRAWVAAAPTLTTKLDQLRHTFGRAIEDLGALRLYDSDEPARLPVVAAGAPWFMTLFGRDSIITSLMALPIDPMLGLGVAQALARLQGSTYVDKTEEEPGRIMHEIRFDASTTLGLGAGETYYGSIDATPLFVVLVDRLHRFGLPDEELRSLLPHVDRALAWVTDIGDRDGDGYLEYRRSTPSGLANQGWKDSWDAVRYHDGRVAEAPIALSEVQGYAYAAFLGRARLARHLGDGAGAERWERRAQQLKAAFNRDFWIESLGWYAMGLDAEKRPIDALASNVGHCLWSGIVDTDRARAVAARLLEDSMWTGWGVRTISSDEPAYSPLSYHCGSVWPHDSAILVAGLRRYGLADVSRRIALGLLDAAMGTGGRLPELFCGLARADVSTPVPFPTSCSPQAWATATPFLLLQVLLGLEPDVPAGTLSINPIPPLTETELHLRGLRLWGQRFDISLDSGHLDVSGFDGLRLEEAGDGYATPAS